MVAYVSRRISGCCFSPPKITAGETRAAKTGSSRRLDTWTPQRKRYTCNFVGKIKAALKIDLLGKGLIRGMEIEAPIHAHLIWPANYGHKRRDFSILKDRRNIVKCRLSSAGLYIFVTGVFSLANNRLLANNKRFDKEVLFWPIWPI